MKKHVVIPFGICLILIVLSGIYIFRQYTRQVETQKELMLWYVSDVKSKLDIIGVRVKELPHIVKPMFDKNHKLHEDLINMFTENISMLESFYIENDYFVKDLSIYDMNGSVFDIHRVSNNEFIRDTYKSRVINILLSETGVATVNNSLSIIVPVIQESTLVGNVSVNLDLMRLQQELYKPYLENSRLWPTTILNEESLLTLPLEGEWILSCENDLLQWIQHRKSGFTMGEIKGLESSARVVTYFESLPIPEQYLGIAFSSSISPFKTWALITFFVVFLILTTITVVSSLFLNRMIVENIETVNKKDKTINVMQVIYDNSPVAFFVSRNDLFFTANNYFFKLFESFASLDDARKLNLPFKVQQEYKEWTLCSFEKKGREISLARRQIAIELDGDRYSIEAFWNVSEMELRVKEAIRSKIAKSELLSRVSSEIRKTLTNVNDSMTLMKKQSPEYECITHANKLIVDLSKMASDVHDYADIESGRIEIEEMPFNLVYEIKKVIDNYQVETQQKGIELQMHIATSAARNVVGDSQRFQQVINELMSNAVKFTDKGFIRISLETTELQGQKILIKCSVDDTGKGMPREELKKIFLLDLRIKNEGDSIGLGVIIIRKLVNMMGGKLSVASPSSISTDPSMPGMRFSFSITCFSDQPLSKNLNYSHIESYQQLRVLIICSDELHVHYLINFLNQKWIQYDVYIHKKDTEDLLTNKIRIDKSRYQIVVIASARSETNFVIADEINRNGLTEHCLYVLIDLFGQKGSYLRAKSLNIDYYLTKNNDFSAYDSILTNHFPNLSDKLLPAHELMRKDLKILIADNNVLGQKVARTVFQKLGYEVDVVENAPFLVNLLNHKTYDIIFIDLKFPPGNGFEIAEMLRKEKKNIPIIAVTSNLSKKNLKHVSDSGMNGHVSKPLNLDSVKQVLMQRFV